MHQLLVLLVVVFVASTEGLIGPGFRVRWTSSNDTTGYFIDIPEDVADVIADGWLEVERYDGLFLELDMYCYKNEATFCAFYDENGHARGFQMALLQSAYSGGPVPMEDLGFSTWRFNYLDYWTIQQFFINDISQTESWNSSKLLQNDAIYVPLREDPSQLMEISADVNKIDLDLFAEQACVPQMGTHHFYDIIDGCDNIFPWFLMYQDGQLVSTGVWIFGTYEYGTRHYAPTVDMFEYGTPDFLRQIAPYANQCIFDTYDTYGGVFAMHTYYVDDVSQISC